jgi:uncharacterized protein with GYD domain
VAGFAKRTQLGKVEGGEPVAPDRKLLYSASTSEGGADMAQFLVEAAYTAESWAALAKNPEDRSQVIQKAVEKLGGKIERTWFSFGEQDVVVILDMPDSVSAAAFSMAVAGGGSCKSVKTIPLLTTQEGIEAMKKAATCGYKPVARAATA